MNNAGYGQFGMVEEISEAQIRARLETNVLGALWVTQAALPLLREQGGGHIIQVSSIGGVSAFMNTGAYHASKWALEGFSQSLSQEVAGFGIKVTLIEPSGYSMSLADTETVRERASGSAERHRLPGMQPAVEHSRRAAPSRAAFWLVAGILCLLFFAAGAPSPLYGIYRAQLGFSATTLTAVFAIYALVLLATLLVFGSVSDYLGRRRVILSALVVTAGACAVFLAARSTGLAAAATVAFRGVRPRTAMLIGCLVLLAGLAVTFAAIAHHRCRFPDRHRGSRRRHRAGAAGRQPHPDRAGPARTARRAHRRHLHHLLPRAQHPGADRRGGNRTRRPAPDRPGLLPGDGRARRGGSRQLDAPQARPRHRSGR